MTQIRVGRYVDCPFSATLELAEIAIKRRSQFSVSPSPALGEIVALATRCTTDSTDSARKHDALLIAWRPLKTGLFPDFRGVLTVRPTYHGASLRLTGQYEAPFGMAGKVFDAMLGRSIARATLRRLLDEVALDIQALYQEERERGQRAHSNAAP